MSTLTVTEKKVWIAPYIRATETSTLNEDDNKIIVIRAAYHYGSETPAPEFCGMYVRQFKTHAAAAEAMSQD